MANYSPFPVAFERGEGAWLFDDKGQAYLDALSGIAVCGLGHAHPGISAAITDQSRKLLHTSNLYQIPLQEQLADKLTKKAGMDKVFFCNSGAEANEAAIKISRLHAHKNNISTPQLIVMEGGFHGRTMATLTATGNRKVQQGFEPLLPGFIRISYNDLNAVETTLKGNPDVCGVLLEPVQGEGGVVVPDPGYLASIRQLCDEYNCLMLLDEVQTGMCRTGKWFAFQHEDIKPDVMTLAKALGNGVPIGACLAHADAAELMQPGSHGSTFGGNPLAARAALSVIEELEQLQAEQKAMTDGAFLLNAFQQSLGSVAGVTGIRGKGMMIGIELQKECAELVSHALDKHLLINVTAGKVIRLLPPLICDQQQLQQIVDTVSGLVSEFLQD